MQSLSIVETQQVSGGVAGAGVILAWGVMAGVITTMMFRGYSDDYSIEHSVGCFVIMSTLAMGFLVNT